MVATRIALAPIGGIPWQHRLNEEKLNAFVGKMLGDIGAAVSSVLVRMGDRNGLYRAMDEGGPQTSAELARRSGTDERYVREWLANQAASGYVEYDSATSNYELPPEHAMLLAREDSPLNMQGLFELIETVMHDEPRLSECLRSGKGFGWHEHDSQLFPATDRFFRPGYAANLVQSWIPALEGVEAKLKRGGRAADVGCGLGSSTVILAKAFPESRIVGFDYHPSSIELARKKARDQGLAGKVTFEVAGAQDFAGQDYDFVTTFDCIHDMGDPVGALARIRKALKPDGTLMIVEPYAEDTLEKNFNAVGRIFYGFSTTLCTPSAKSQPGGYSLARRPASRACARSRPRRGSRDSAARRRRRSTSSTRRVRKGGKGTAPSTPSELTRAMPPIELARGVA